MTKFESVSDRLVQKIGLSQSAVPGFIIGLSGTDSIVAFLLAYNAFDKKGTPDRLMGIHYRNPMNYEQGEKKKLGWFETEIIPWLKLQCPKAHIVIDTPLGGNQDQQRWADLHLRALNEITYDGAGNRKFNLYDDGKGYWVAGTINATEKYLGTYSVLANTASIQLLQSFWKSEILEICKELNVPNIAIEYSRIPDCLCGRDELAAENIELIDQIIRNKIVPSQHDVELLDKLFAYIAEKKKLNDFKLRIPYTI